ncbi:MAG TPA: cation:proton antiporter [Terriglobales bacterium]|nr:cation:proton antiporter [Terriglobales bacterium]
MHAADPFLLQLLVIFGSAKIMGEIFERLKLPAVLGEILAGIVLGPYAFGMIQREVIQDGHPINSLAGLGAIFLLFSVGLETPAGQLLKVGKRSLNVAMGGVALPFIFGFGYWILTGHSGAQSMFIATAMVATSVGITARVMGDLGVLKTRAAQIILSAAVFDDILGMVLLAVVAGMAATSGVDWTQIVIVLTMATVFSLFMIFIAPHIVTRVKGPVEKMSTRHAPLILALALCLALSVLAEKIGMAGIIGAFFAGLAIADHAHNWNLEPGIDAIRDFLAPVFFFIMGAKLDTRVFSTDILVAAIVISVLAIVSKMVGCGLPVLKEGRKTALIVGVGMVPRGEVGLIVALVGLNMNLIDQAGFAIVMFMTGITTIIAPIALRILLKGEPRTATV